MTKLRPLLLATCLPGLSLMACAPISSRATEGALESGLETADEPQNQQTFQEIAQDPQVRAAIEDLSAQVGRGLTRGVKDGMFGDEQDASPLEAGGSVAEHVAQGLVDGGLASAASPQNRAHARRFVEEITEAAVGAATRSVAEGLEAELGPTVRDLGRQASASTAETLASDEVREAVGSIAFTLSRQAALGLNSAAEEVARENRREDQGILGRVSTIGWAIFAALCVLVVAIAAMAIVLFVRDRHYRKQIADANEEQARMLERLNTKLPSEGGRMGVPASSPA